MREPLSEAHIRSHVPGEEGDSWFWTRTGPRLCEFVYSPLFFFYGLKGLVFFLADKQKTALCVSVISLPGLAAKPASAAPSVELALRSQCHTERAAFQTTKNRLCVCETVCVVDSMQGFFFFFPICVFVHFIGEFYSPCLSNADNIPKLMNMQHSLTF